MLNHAFFKCQLFYAAGAVYQSTHTVDIERLGGLARLMPWTAASFLIGGIAISALPPLNGFASEFVIYSGLFSNAASGVWAKLALGVAGAVLAFVGAVSALSITRAFGVAFLGTPRDPHVARGTEASRWMLVPMGIHTAGAIVLGVLPAVGFMLVRGPTELAMGPLSASAAAVLPPIVDTLTRIGMISGALVASIALVLWLRSKAAAAPAASHVTWSCGYAAPNPRMQYTGASFSSDFGARFRGFMILLRRKKSPAGYFPSDSYVITDCVDAVERRLFSVISRGDASAADLSAKLREDDPRVAFAAGLVAVIVIGGLVLLVVLALIIAAARRSKRSRRESLDIGELSRLDRENDPLGLLGGPDGLPALPAGMSPVPAAPDAVTVKRAEISALADAQPAEVADLLRGWLAAPSSRR